MCCFARELFTSFHDGTVCEGEEGKKMQTYRIALTKKIFFKKMEALTFCRAVLELQLSDLLVVQGVPHRL